MKFGDRLTSTYTQKNHIGKVKGRISKHFDVRDSTPVTKLFKLSLKTIEKRLDPEQLK